MRVAVVFDTPYRRYRPEDHDVQCALDLSRAAVREPDMEYQVAQALRASGHHVSLLGVHDDATEALAWLRKNPVDLVFNAAEQYGGRDSLDYLLPALLESENQRFTGAPPISLLVTRNKATSKQILAHHGISVAAYRTYHVGEEVEADPGLRYPVIVKPLSSDGSAGIAQASIVRDRAQLAARVEFVHEGFGGAIVEEYIDGREFYVGLLGNGDDVELLPILELVFDNDRTAPEERIATVKAKWDDSYRQKHGIRTQGARPLSQKALARLQETCRVAFEALWLRDYGRLDLRIDDDDNVWVLEANANPYLSRGHEIAQAAEKAGISYEALLERIVQTAMKRP
jgi:D-alanine-D-alanine ligase